MLFQFCSQARYVSTQFKIVKGKSSDIVTSKKVFKTENMHYNYCDEIKFPLEYGTGY